MTHNKDHKDEVKVTSSDASEDKPIVSEHEASDKKILHKSHHGKRRIAILIALASLLLLAAGVWFWQGVMNAPKAEDKQTANLKSYEQTLAVATLDLVGVPVSATATNPLGGQTDAGYTVYEFAAYKTAGKPFKNLPRTGQGNSVATDATGAEANKKKIIDHLKTAGLKELDGDVNDAHALSLQQNVTLTSYDVFASGDSVCTVSHIDGTKMSSSPEVAKIAHVVGVGCASIVDYNSVANEVMPFYEAYKEANTATDNDIYTAPDTQAGVNGQKHAVLFQKSSASPVISSHYYYTGASAGSGWTFLSAAPRGLPSCDQLSTSVQKNAFKGSKCYESQDSIKTVE